MDTAAVSYQVVLTKADKVKASDLEKTIARVSNDLAKHPAAYPDLIVTSSRKGTGLTDLRTGDPNAVGQRVIVRASQPVIRGGEETEIDAERQRT